MAGLANNPNSPRQKMINLMYLVFIAMMALNVSTEVLDGFELVEDSLHTSIDNASKRNGLVAGEIDDYYQTNPAKVQEWYLKKNEVKQKSDSLYNYILLPWEIRNIFTKRSAALINGAMLLGYTGFYMYSIYTMGMI